jgi:hypothetical protein
METFKHPLPFIKELETIPVIKSVQDIIFINDFVFSLIPWSENSYRGTSVYDNIEYLYNGFKNKEIGGWCGLCAEFFKVILSKYGISTRPYNFGLDFYKLTHIGIIVTYDGMNMFFDPYFAKYFKYCGNSLLTLESLLTLVETQQYDKIVPVYGSVTKPVQRADKWEFWSPVELEKSVFGGFGLLGYEKIMEKIFKNQRFENLMLIEYYSTTAKILRNIGNIINEDGKV